MANRTFISQLKNLFWTPAISKTIETKSKLERLPKYVLYQILLHVRFIDLRNVAYLNKYFRERIFDAAFWQFNVKSKFDSISDDIPTKNIPRWYYEKYKIFNTELLGNGSKHIRSFSFSDKYIAKIDDDGTLYIKSWYKEQISWPQVKSIFCASDGLYFITQKSDLYVLGYNPFGESSDDEPMYITNQVSRVHRHGFQLIIEKDLQLYNVSHGKMKPLNSLVKDFKSRTTFLYYYISLDDTLYESNDCVDRVLAKNVKSFGYNRELIFWINIWDKLYVSDFKSDESKCLCENIKKFVCTDQKIYILTQTGVLNSIPVSPSNQIESLSLETIDVVDFNVNRDKIITVTLP